jgi:hypothetical protein
MGSRLKVRYSSLFVLFVRRIYKGIAICTYIYIYIHICLNTLLSRDGVNHRNSDRQSSEGTKYMYIYMYVYIYIYMYIGSQWKHIYIYVYIYICLNTLVSRNGVNHRNSVGQSSEGLLR